MTKIERSANLTADFWERHSIGDLDRAHENLGLDFPCADGHIIMAVNEEEADEG